MITYKTEFNLTHPIKADRIAEAHKYLIEDDMTEYLWDDDHCTCRDDVLLIWWQLEDVDHGSIMMRTRRELTREELDSISEWVKGQCSDGLGEGFEQQDFACEYDTRWADHDYDEFDPDDEGWMASFDWETNDYKFEMVK